MMTMNEKATKLENLFGVERPNDVDFKEWIKTLENMEAGYKKKINKNVFKIGDIVYVSNPDNYNEDGTIKKQGNKKVVWNKSNHYKKYQNELKELYRKQADIRKYQHECLANYIISLGDKVYVEKIFINYTT